MDSTKLAAQLLWEQLRSTQREKLLKQVSSVSASASANGRSPPRPPRPPAPPPQPPLNEDSDSSLDIQIFTISSDEEEDSTGEVGEKQRPSKNSAPPPPPPRSTSEESPPPEEENDEVLLLSEEGPPPSAPPPTTTTTTTTELSDSDNDSSSISSFDSDWDDNDPLDVIFLSNSSDSDSPSSPSASKGPFTCYRCPPSKKSETFRNRKAYLFHIKRHRSGDIFNCPECSRPFLQFNLCVAHEITVHAKDIPEICYDKRDPVISMAKDLMEMAKKLEKPKKKAPKDNEEGEGPQPEESEEPEPEPEESESEDDLVEEIEMYNEEHIVTSTTLLPYKGPPVGHQIECYEIQMTYGHEKGQRHNATSNMAIEYHIQNVQNGWDIDRLGKFSKRKRRIPTTKVPPPPKSSASAGPSRNKRGRGGHGSASSSASNSPVKKRPCFSSGASTSTSTSSSSPRPSIQNVRGSEEIILEEEEEEEERPPPPKTFPRRSSSPSSCGGSFTELLFPAKATATSAKLPLTTHHGILPDDFNDDDYDDLFVPVRQKKKRGRPPASENVDVDDVVVLSSPPRRQITEEPSKISESSSLALPALLKRICQRCNYRWKDVQDLQRHRDAAHPKRLLVDLMSIPPPQAPEGHQSQSQGQSRGQRPSSSKEGGKGRKLSGKSKLLKLFSAGKGGKAKYGKFKLRSKTFQTCAPEPDSTFTEKEKFLYDLGLSNQIRLDLHWKRPVGKELLKECSVRVEKMDESEFAYHWTKMIRKRRKNDKTSHLPQGVGVDEDLLGVHFLLC